MKLILSLIVVLVIVCGMISPALCQSTALIAGPGYNDGLCFELAVAQRVSTTGWMAAFTTHGKSSESHVEFAQLFKITEKLYGGPILGTGVDQSNMPGMDGSTAADYWTMAAGLAGTYSFTDKFGVAGYWRFQSAPGDNNYQNKATGGIGLFFRMSLKHQ